jgi:stearoyl-CoA desaturase (delta-9 desaturase)
MIKYDQTNAAPYVLDLLVDPIVTWTNGKYYWWVALGLVLPAALGGLLSGQPAGMLTGLFWGGFVRMFVVAQTMNMLNSCFHTVGSRSFNTVPDNSRNCGMLSLLTWGEAWHNNHHAFPYSAAFGLEWYQFDPGFWLVRGLQASGIVWNVKVPQPAKIAEKRSASAISPEPLTG